MSIYRSENAVCVGPETGGSESGKRIPRAHAASDTTAARVIQRRFIDRPGFRGTIRDGARPSPPISRKSTPDSSPMAAIHTQKIPAFQRTRGFSVSTSAPLTARQRRGCYLIRRAAVLGGRDEARDVGLQLLRRCLVEVGHMAAFVVLELDAIAVRLVEAQVIEAVLSVRERRRSIVVAGADHDVKVRILCHGSPQFFDRTRVSSVAAGAPVPASAVATHVVLQIAGVAEVVVEIVHEGGHECAGWCNIRRVVILSRA